MKVRELVAELRPFLEIAPDAEILIQVVGSRAYTVVPVAVDRASRSHEIHVIARTHAHEEAVERKQGKT